MNRGLVKQWNGVTTKYDTVIHAGDMFMLNSSKRGFEFAEKIINFLLFRELLIVPGNHDIKLWRWIESHEPDYLKENRITICDQIHEIKTVDPTGLGLNFVICHYPMLTWNKRAYRSIQLHGHTHSSMRVDVSTPRRVNIGVDAWGFMPATEEEILKVVKEASKENEKHKEY